MGKLYYETKPGELQHGLFDSLKKRANTKYIMKVPLGNGKFRYLYTQEEVNAYKNMSAATKKRTKTESDRRNKAYKEDMRNNEYKVISDKDMRINDESGNQGSAYQKTSGKKGSRFGTYERTDKDTGNSYTYTHKRSNNLLSSRGQTVIEPGTGLTGRKLPSHYETTYEEGLIRQNYNYTKDKISKAVEKGEKKVKKILKKLTKSKKSKK